MPELPEVEASRRLLAPAMTGARFRRVFLARPDLRVPFPPGFSRTLQGARVGHVDRRGKYLLVEVSSGHSLLMHLGMSGSFRLEAGEAQPAGAHDHVLFAMSSGVTVVFSDPRRFGFMDLVAAGMLEHHPALSRLGPEPLSREFDAAALAAACVRRRTSLKVALMDQEVVAGLGNIYASEALHHAHLSPQRAAAAVATPTGKPRASAYRLVGAIRTVLQRAIARTTSEIYRSSPFRVYGREGAPCLRRGCGGVVARVTQGGRSTFFCGRCQR